MKHRPLPFIFCLLLIASCKWLGKQEPQPTNTSIKDKPNTQMPIPALPVMGDYADDWKIVDSLQNNGLFKSALEKVEAIQARAKKDKNSQQLVKALLFRGKYITQLEEDGLTKAIQTIETEAKTAHQPEKALLQSILGQLYATYLSNMGWNLQQRTPIPDGEGGDILTWSAAQIEKHALELYIASVTENSALISETPVQNFKDVLTPGENDSIAGEALRPTLYDLLCHRALEHFANDRSYLTEPAYVFVLDQVDAFAPREIFVQGKFTTKDSLSGKWLAMKTFQNVLREVRISDKGKEKTVLNVAQLVDADLLRLQFAYNNSTLENKKALYQKALEDLLTRHQNHPVSTEVAHQLAAFRYGLDSDKPANAKAALLICEDAIRRHPKSYGASYCQALIDEIRATSINTNVEEVNLPNKNVLVQVGFRNVKKVWVKVVKGDFERMKWYNSDEDAHFKFLNKQPALQTRSWELQDPGDYQQHQTEIALDPLPLGNYWVFVSENPGFSSDKSKVAYSNFAVSNLAPVSYNELGQAYFILADRTSGTPAPGVKLEFFQFDYNNGPRQLKTIGDVSTNRDGIARTTFPENISVLTRATLGKDSLWIGQTYGYRYYRNTVEQKPQVQFFTDRAIYRPGQTVYFKGLVFRNTATGSEKFPTPQIVPNQTVTVKFYDANGQVKNTLKLKSNEYGTFNGAFAAPASGLTGQMSIHAEDGAWGYAYFSVEEYKRPRFEVTMKPVEGAFRVNDKITMRGEAKNYAGNVVDGAQVRYRVVRVARFPFWDYYRYWKRPSYYNTSEMEITNGVATTGADGTFAIDFTAIPDASIPKKDQPIFDYQVYVDITDITGETRSTTGAVSAGYVALQVDWGLTSEVSVDSLRKIGVHTTNMANQKQAAEGQITLQRLVEPKQFYQSRLWERPDIVTLTKGDFEKMFPNLAWKDEDDPAKWGREDQIRTIRFNTANAETVDLLEGRTQPGWYVARLTTQDAFGEKIEIERIVRVFDQNTRFEKPSAVVEKDSYEPGETAKIAFGGKPEGLVFYFAQEKDGVLQQPQWISSHLKGLSSVELKVAESDRGGIVGHWFAIKDNRMYGVGQLMVNVPWSNKDLTISYETFRDKLAPGQKETWSIKISGPKKDKVAAEMVAAMYDASLDQFRPHQWSVVPFPIHYASINFGQSQTYGFTGGLLRYENPDVETLPSRAYPALNWFNFPMWGGRPRYALMERSMMADQVIAPAPGTSSIDGGEVKLRGSMKKDANYYIDGIRVQGGAPPVQDEEQLAVQSPAPTPPAPPAQIRRNLNETVFFFPELRTDAAGNVVLNFTMNEALTRWNLLTFSHTKDLKQAVSVKEVVTQKELMVIANPPRFLREGDEMEFSAKVSNLSKEQLAGTATLNLLDAATLQPVEREFGLAPNNRIARFSVLPGQSAAIAWRIKVPDNFNGAVTWQIYADSKSFRDGEESTIPVVSNRMLVTETMPISVRGNQTKSFVFENLKNKGASASLQSHHYALEFTSNPVWYVVQALPYLMEYPHECSEQVFSRFYANTLAANVVDKMPQIKRVMERWKGTDAMKSNLSKNQELKYALLEETPWVLAAQSEEQQKQNIALLFDLNRMANEQERAINTLAERQYNSGGWPWFAGGPDSWYITQHITCGMMHLQKLGAFDRQKDQKSANMVDKALGYCDGKMVQEYQELEKLVAQGKAKFEDDHLSGMAIQYLYTRSFSPMDRPTKEVGYYLNQAAKYWLGKGIYQEGMLALALHRFGNKEAAAKIVNSLRERAQMKDELGMYWAVDWGFYWYQLPVETQALMVEVFGEVANDMKSVEELRIWLLKNKQTNRWESTKATSEAVYAMLLFGDNWLNNTKPVQVTIGGKPLKVNEYEAGTGYFKQSWNGAEVKDSWAEIKVENPNANIAWGAAYWQYFEDLDKIKDFQKTPLTIVKQLFTEENSPTGPVLKPILEGQTLKRGDKIKVRIEIRVDRAMEFVHLKDMRASGFEPVNVLSSYRWQGGLGYYESTKDLATHFFIDYLPRGTYVFEYPLVVSLRGDMSNGITTMQCMYAPEFTSHSKGLRVKVE